MDFNFTFNPHKYSQKNNYGIIRIFYEYSNNYMKFRLSENYLKFRLSIEISENILIENSKNIPMNPIIFFWKKLVGVKSKNFLYIFGEQKKLQLRCCHFMGLGLAVETCRRWSLTGTWWASRLIPILLFFFFWVSFFFSINFIFSHHCKFFFGSSFFSLKFILFTSLWCFFLDTFIKKKRTYFDKVTL